MDEDISRRETNKQGDVLEDFVKRNRRLVVGALLKPTVGI
jgi:hypothetical protein